MSEFEDNILYQFSQRKIDSIKFEGLQAVMFDRAIKFAGECIPLKREVIREVFLGAIYDWQRNTGHFIAEVRLMRPENQGKCMISLGKNFANILLKEMDSGIPRKQIDRAVNLILRDFEENFKYVDQIH